MTVDDSLLEGDEELTFTVSGLSETELGISIVNPQSHILTIIDNDGKRFTINMCVSSSIHIYLQYTYRPMFMTSFVKNDLNSDKKC